MRCCCGPASTWPATVRAKPIPWVTTIMVPPCPDRSFITSSISPTVTGSSAEVGSSNSGLLRILALHDDRTLGDVLRHAEVRKEVVALEHHRALRPQPGQSPERASRFPYQRGVSSIRTPFSSPGSANGVNRRGSLVGVAGQSVRTTAASDSTQRKVKLSSRYKRTVSES